MQGGTFLQEGSPLTPSKNLKKAKGKGKWGGTRECVFTPMGPLPHSCAGNTQGTLPIDPRKKPF